jgi:hypothetical protein
MTKEYHAILLDVEFKDPKFIEKWKLLGKKRSSQNRWWQLKVEVPESRLEEMINDGQSLLLDDKYYFHIYREGELIIVWSKRIFYIKPDKSTWREMLEYGRSIGIPEDQLDMKPTKFKDETY